MARVVKWFTGVENIAAYLGAICLLVIMGLTAIDVVARYLRSVAFPGTYELVELLLGAGGSLTLAYVQRRGAHVAIEFLAGRIPRRVMTRIEIATFIIMFATFIFLTWRTGAQSILNWRTGEYTMGIVHWRIWPFKICLFIGLGLLALRTLIQLGERVTFLTGERESS